MDVCTMLLLLSLLKGLDVSSAYNVEMMAHKWFSWKNSSLFGYKVAQFSSSSGQRVLVGDPGSNLLLACDVHTEDCDNIDLPYQSSASHLGLTLEVEPVSGRCLVCGSEEPHDCSKALYMNGACYTVDASLKASEKMTPGYQECQKAEVDLCFLFDDSYSVGSPEFESVRKFLLNVIENLKNSTVQFAVVRFETNAEKVFDFKDYQRGEVETNILNMTHKGGTTNTYRAINFTLNEIFTPEAGAREQAKKILLLLTDGEATDKDNGTIGRADKLQVTRHIIGVGKNFGTELTIRLLRKLASKPQENHTHEMQDYASLEGFFIELQTKILAIEGVSRGSNFSREMSSAGLSAALTEDWEILGDPGIFDWSGGILNISSDRLLYLSQEEKAGYLGYSVRLFRTSRGLFCVVGSPRFQYVGLVSVLEEVPGEARWEKIGSILGEQVGSYFGAEIAVSDLDQDGMTDLVLISAPHHYEVKWSGQVSVCHFSEALECTVTLHGEPGHLQSQFGAAVSSLGDLDGDGFTEVAVGAPYEMDGRGALYIYKGGRAGLSAVHSQRLLSPPGVLGFGLSVHGVLDMTEDGLVDVAVGSWGSVTLHRSQPLLCINVSVTSNQTSMVVSILEASDCDQELTLEACVLIEILTPEYRGPLSLSIQYSLLLDSHKPESRMSFTNESREMNGSFTGKQREMNGTMKIERGGLQCHNHTIFLQDCRLEDVSEVQVSFAAFPEQLVSPWLLSPSSELSATGRISFQMCVEGKMCEPDMKIKVNHSELVVQDGAPFSMSLSLCNLDETAHQTTLSISVPDGLRFRKASVTEASHRVSLVCGDFKEQILMCNASHPYQKRRVSAVIHIMFSVASNVTWADYILLALNVTSDGNKTSSSEEYEVPVLYPIHVISRSLEDSTKYVSFLRREERTMTHKYQIQNLGLNAFPMDISVSVSSKLALEDLTWDFIISSPEMKNSNFNCSGPTDSSAIQTHGKEPETFTVQKWSCIMDRSSEMNIFVSGVLKPTKTWKVTRSVSVRSAVMIGYDELRYYSNMGGTFHTAQVVTHVDLLVSPDHMPYIVGGSAGGVILMMLISFLLYKCGFFKSYKERMMEETGTTGEAPGPLQPLTSNSLGNE